MAGSATVAALFAQRVVIGVGDLAVSNNPQVTLSTYALGSCIGIVAYAPSVRAGGILHFMLPDSTISPEKAVKQPAMFADTGFPMFFKALTGLRGDRSNLRILVAGGASVITGTDPFRIGERNGKVAAEYLSRFGYVVRHSITGGNVNRTLHLDLTAGIVSMKTPNENVQFSLAS